MITFRTNQLKDPVRAAVEEGVLNDSMYAVFGSREELYISQEHAKLEESKKSTI